MRVIGKSALLPFQNGFMISIRSLQSLYTDLHSEGYTYIMAARCNQDILESYFSVIRGLGKFYDHPLPTTISQRIKSLLVGKHAASVINSANSRNEEDSVTLSANLIKDFENEHDEAETVLATECCSSPIDEEDLTSVFESEFPEIVNQTEPNKEESKDLLKMLAGYVAYRVRKRGLDTTFRYGYVATNDTVIQTDWLSKISRGSLMNPTEEWLNIVYKMEQEFNAFHGAEINKNCMVISTLTNLLKSKFAEIDDFAISCYARTRTFIRMKALNKQINLKRSTYRNVNTDNRLKKMKKLKKLVK